MSYFSRAAPALVQILNRLHKYRLHNVQKPTDVDQNLYESGSVRYHVKASALDPQVIYLSISTPNLSTEDPPSVLLPNCNLEDIKKAYYDTAEIVEPPREGFVLTLRLDFAKFPQKKEDCIKVINEISSLQAVILCSQLKAMLWNLSSQDMIHGIYKPIKLVHHPKEHFFVIRTPERITAIFPMRFKENSDVVLATSFFEELSDVGYSAAFAKAPRCTWSPIPPLELKGESFHYLTTNGGFVSFNIFPHHVKGAKMDKVLWILLNFNTYVKNHVKCTRGFIQRMMRQRLDGLAEVMRNARIGRDVEEKEILSCRCVKKLSTFSKSIGRPRKGGAFVHQINRIRSRIRIKGLDRVRRRWFKFPKFASFNKYDKID